jgi:GT2 family glycosyltransferase
MDTLERLAFRRNHNVGIDGVSVTADSLDLGIVILNWNGASDTIECLRSIYSGLGRPSRVILVDNGSTDDSVARIRQWVTGNALETQGLTIIEAGRNLGFSAGNNIGIRQLIDQGVAYVMLLNNDTVVQDDALAILLHALNRTVHAHCAVPQIRYLSTPNRIWNCGGEWSWSNSPKYRFAEESIGALEGKPPFPVTFVTGCALVVRSDWFASNGLLSERFFFGEEDVEFSWRMRESGSRTMICVPSAVIYHKVGTSITKMAESSRLPKVYCHYLNRLILLKSVWGKGLRWYAWRIGVLAYLARTLARDLGFGPRQVVRVLRDLAHDSSEKDSVSADFFFWLMKEKFSRLAQP